MFVVLGKGGDTLITRKDLFVALFSFCLAATLFVVLPSRSATNPYDPWADVSGPTLGVPNGTINMRDINYLIQRFNTFGTPIDRSSLMSIEYDSGWANITDKCGQDFNVTHNLNSTDLIVDIQGRTTLEIGPHQKHYGLTGYTQGWFSSCGGTNEDQAYALVQTSDGGYALAGHTYSFGAGSADFWLVRTDAAGNMMWNRTYGGAGGDRVEALVQTRDGGYALAGWTWSFGAGGDLWMVKTDVESGLAWTDSTADTLTFYRGATDLYWNFVRVRIWKSE